ncbi:MAG: class I SAM-dependent methyltransferase [Agarilytica sp.]
MAIVWRGVRSGNAYEVRKAGNSVRLYTDGVFHSQWNPRRPFAGHLWDLLFLPALFHGRVWDLENCILLGLGGGAVINMFNTFTQVKNITAVDLDPIHIKLAKRYFIENNTNVSLVENDARVFLASQGHNPNISTKADIIIDDLFYGVESAGNSTRREAVRAVEVDSAWLSVLSDNLRSDGILVVNFESENQMRQALKPKQLSSSGFVSHAYFRHPRYENVIGVCFKAGRDLGLFKRNLERLKCAYLSAQVGGLRYELVAR